MMVSRGHPHRPGRPRQPRRRRGPRLGHPAVVGADAIKIAGGSFTVGDVTVSEGDVISIDGSTGEVVLGRDLAAAEPPAEFDVDPRLGRQDPQGQARRCGPTPTTARTPPTPAQFGAEGIGLCRTEHMFLGEDRLPVVRR